jgi:hypothetical protein
MINLDNPNVRPYQAFVLLNGLFRARTKLFSVTEGILEAEYEKKGTYA